MPLFRTEAILTLPEPPPSVNSATANVEMADGRSRQIATAEYKAWTQYACLKLNGQKGLIGKFYWRADIFFPGRMTKADLDNLQKGTFDAMRKADKTPDDRYLVDLRVRWWARPEVSVALRAEDARIWGPIRGASARLIKELNQHLQ